MYRRVGRRCAGTCGIRSLTTAVKPQFFVPDFDWVTLDSKKELSRSNLPKVQEDISKIEDPNDYLKIKNSVTIAATAIRRQRENADRSP